MSDPAAKEHLVGGGTMEAHVDDDEGRVVWEDEGGALMGVPVADVVAASPRALGPNEAACRLVAWCYPPVAGLAAACRACCGGGAPALDHAAERVRREVDIAFRGPGAADRAERLCASVRDALAAHVGAASGDAVLLAPGAPLRKLLVVVNPASGPGTGLQRFNKHCKPLLCDAGYDVETVVTSRPRHATQHLLALPPAQLAGYDGILACGGDGSLHEVLQGFLDRPDAATLLAAGRPRFGVIPTGSGNGLAFGFCAAAGLPFSLSNCAMLVAHRRACRMDIASVFTAQPGGGDDDDALPPPASDLPRPGSWGRRHFSFLSLEWGIIADLDIESEVLRCLGGARFDVYGAIRGLFLRKYQGRLSWLPAEPSPRRAGGGGDPAPASVSHEVIAVPVEPLPPSAFPGGGVGAGKAEGFGPASDGGVDWAAPYRVRSLLPFDAPLPEAGAGGGWRSAEGLFTYLWITNTSHQTIGMATAPEGRADDGVLTITLVRDVGPSQMLPLLLEMDEKGTFRRHACVEVHRARAYRLEPDTRPDRPGARGGHIVVDGELVPYAATQAEVHPRLLPVFGAT